MDQFDIKYDQVMKSIDGFYTSVYNQLQEKSLSVSQYQAVIDKVEVLRQELAVATNSLTGN